ncbi:hypothetical protein TNIN_294071 [Trichonephila inaurata madagascariensis]|uniref:Uncharacterized protein n=1 Tax=Trichonephila inaurata madagascariensis TaxID=2747483 RepID=A0A8X6XAW0_9ARAC|nr:hypothetical protein TNIN_294071 [Trichonephila inaurata madagascariensis]
MLCLSSKANGLIEKDCIAITQELPSKRDNSKWSEFHPIVLLGMRSAVKRYQCHLCRTCLWNYSDCHLTFLHGTRLPPPAIKPMSPFYLKNRALQPIPTSVHSNSSMFCAN